MSDDLSAELRRVFDLIRRPPQERIAALEADLAIVEHERDRGLAGIEYLEAEVERWYDRCAKEQTERDEARADLATRTQERDDAREALTALATAAGGAIESLQSAEETLSETGHELVRVMGDLRDRRVILKRVLAALAPPSPPEGGPE